MLLRYRHANCDHFSVVIHKFLAYVVFFFVVHNSVAVKHFTLFWDVKRNNIFFHIRGFLYLLMIKVTDRSIFF